MLQAAMQFTFKYFQHVRLSFISAFSIQFHASILHISIIIFFYPRFMFKKNRQKVDKETIRRKPGRIRHWTGTVSSGWSHGWSPTRPKGPGLGIPGISWPCRWLYSSMFNFRGFSHQSAIGLSFLFLAGICCRFAGIFAGSQRPCLTWRYQIYALNESLSWHAINFTTHWTRSLASNCVIDTAYNQKGQWSTYNQCKSHHSMGILTNKCLLCKL